MSDHDLLTGLAGFSTPSILNGLDRLGVHPEELETTDCAAIRCMPPRLRTRVGFAVTRQVTTRRHGDRAPVPSFASRHQDDDIGTVPAPRFLVVDNVGDWQGPVCIWGEVVANISRAMGIVAGLTNGPVRDLTETEAAGFQTSRRRRRGRRLRRSRGLRRTGDGGRGGRRTGDPLHGDVHGVVKIPRALAPDLPDAIRAHEAMEQGVIEVCRAPGFHPGRARRGLGR